MAFRKKKQEVPFSVIILAVGAGQFTLTYKLQDILDRGFHAIDLAQTLGIFANLSIAGADHVYDDWIASLQAEQTRARRVDQELAMRDSLSDPSLHDVGYRLGFAIFYMFYDKLRTCLEVGEFKGWDIYSGSNNPVMNWNTYEGWVTIALESGSIDLYWEFNRQALHLKANIKERTTARWGQWKRIRTTLIEWCESCPVEGGHPTRSRKGISVSAYKWEFNFCEETLGEIADKTNRILSYMHPCLRQKVESA